MNDRNRTGKRAEFLAAWWLRLKGFCILARGWSNRRGSGAGEIDIVAKRGSLLIFVEVKARADRDKAAHALRPAQRQRISRGAQAFVAAHPHLQHCAMRFDVILVSRNHWPCHISDAWRMDA